jgi:hypothetical protein
MNNKGYWLSYILFFWGLLGWKFIFVFHQWQRWNWGNQGAITSRKITSSTSFLRLFHILLLKKPWWVFPFSLANGGLAGSPPTSDVWVEN